MMEVMEIVMNQERNVRMSAWIQDVAGEYGGIKKRPAILILPGGGYSMCSDREAEPVAAVYLAAGFQTFILRYSTGEYKTWPNPLEDYEAAITMIRQNTDTWHVDGSRVAVIGFSAGGHLAACAATIADNRPDAVILGYAALKKDICDMCQPGMPYPAEHVDEKTPPCFMFAARDDSTVDVSNTVEFQKALLGRGIAFESHIYSYGGHGFSIADPHVSQSNISGRVKNWVHDSIGWLGEIWGVLTSKGFTEPTCDRFVHADFCEKLSVNCTIGHLKKQNEEVQILLQDIYAEINQIIRGRFENPERAAQIIDGYRLSDILQMLQMPDNVLHDLNTTLQNIKNKQNDC